MIYLLLAILCGSTFAVLFKVFSLRHFDTLQAVAVNYLTAFLLGIAFNLSGGTGGVNPFDYGWWWIALLMGVGFMAAFVLMSLSTARSGVAVTTVSARVSLVIPVVCSYLLLPAQVSPRWLPIVLVIVALVLIVVPKKQVANSRRKPLEIAGILLPVVVFLLFGLNNFFLKFVQNGITDRAETATFTATIFLSAMVACVIFYLVRNRGRVTLCTGSLWGGVLLGAANFFATYLTLLSLETLPAGLFFPIYNVSIVAISVLVGVFIFGERLTLRQFIGLFVSVVGIVLFFV
ncbi:MAG: EamA family transporter [Tidjanibacter sp.]|nr:EamA family transporter [Tidjanibacter sp.]